MKMEMTTAALACVASASAFVAPSAFNGAAVQSAQATSGSVTMQFGGKKKAPAKPSSSDFATAIGAQPPIGFWDPAGLLTGADQERFDRLRYVEIKHGRISMLAVAGHLIQQNYRLPGMLAPSADLSFADMPNGIAALYKIPPLGFMQIVLFIGALELGVMKQKEGSFPGDMTLGGNPFQKQWDSFSEETKTSKRAIELNNGRAAQMGIFAMMCHEQISNQPYIINDLFGKGYTFP